MSKYEIESWLNKLYELEPEEVDDKSDPKLDLKNIFEVESYEMEVSLDETEEDGDDALPIRIVNEIFKQAIEEHASDIHIEPHESSLEVRLRIDGSLTEIGTYEKRFQSGIISRLKIIAGLDISEKRIPQDGRIKINAFGRTVDLRVSTLPTIYGEKTVMRILDKGDQSLDILALGFEKEQLDKFMITIARPYGMILVTGPTGSGKTTTLYSALSHVNSPDKNLITVEDPVEFRLPGINQVQVKSEVGLTFAAGLRAILRQDPDIVMVGEIRDTETAEIAIRAALTGHLVFSTLHTNNSIDTIMRLVDMEIDKYLLCSAINLVIAQRLVRQTCLFCVEPYEVNPALFERLGVDKSFFEGVTFVKGKGCEVCRGKGFSGRLPIFEFFFLNNELREMIMSNASVDEIRLKATEVGMESLLINGLKRVKTGLTTIEEVLKVASEN